MKIFNLLWNKLILDPNGFKKINGWATVLWVVMIPVSIVTGWVTKVEYVSALSLWALVAGHLSIYQSARVEERQEAQGRADLEKIERKIDDLHARVCEDED